MGHTATEYVLCAPRGFEATTCTKGEGFLSDYRKYVPLDDALFDYVLANTTAPDAVQRALMTRTNELGGSRRMQIAHPQAVFMNFLTRSIGARSALEIGTFTGYSALAIARGLPPDGRLIACDVSEEWTAIAREAWTAAGMRLS